MTIRYACWAKSESEASALQALGWCVGQSEFFHHNAYSLLLVWEGDGVPPVLESEIADG